MLNTMQDVEFMMPYPANYVTNQIRPRILDLSVGGSIQFKPNDYSGVPMFHFHNTLMTVLAKEFGQGNIKTFLDKQEGVIEARRIG
jgi:hypothetical protein